MFIIFSLSRFHPLTNKLGMSYAVFRLADISSLGVIILKLLSMLRLVTMETIQTGEDKGKVRVNNLTLINFVLKVIGPVHEATLTTVMLALQVLPLTVTHTLTINTHVPPHTHRC